MEETKIKQIEEIQRLLVEAIEITNNINKNQEEKIIELEKKHNNKKDIMTLHIERLSAKEWKKFKEDNIDKPSFKKYMHFDSAFWVYTDKSEKKLLAVRSTNISGIIDEFKKYYGDV